MNFDGAGGFLYELFASWSEPSTVVCAAYTFASWRAAGRELTKSTAKTIEANSKLVLLTPTTIRTSPTFCYLFGWRTL